jgi:hypothetical protein
MVEDAERDFDRMGLPTHPHTWSSRPTDPPPMRRRNQNAIREKHMITTTPESRSRRWLRSLAVTVIVFGLAMPAQAASTAVPGHQHDRYDQDHNGYPDEGVTVTGKYESLYAEDGHGDYYWDLGDGRIYKTVNSVDDLDQATLTVCDYQVQYRGNFENDPFLDSGWIKNDINCSGFDSGTYNYLIVQDIDHRYTGNPDWAIWGTWEYHVYTVSGEGNLVRRPDRPAAP